MPYIKKETREFYKELTNKIDDYTILAVGDLTYLLYTLCLSFISSHGKKFINVCLVMGSLFCCALEFYRRIIAPYEDEKIKENGDVK